MRKIGEKIHLKQFVRVATRILKIFHEINLLTKH